jgi:hypothetical protein
VKDLEAVHEMSERNGPVGLPVLNGFRRLYEDDEIIVVALEVDLHLWYVSAHDCNIVTARLEMFDR